MYLNENNAELMGAIAGDGHIYRKYNKYRIGFTGHPITDKLYFEYLRELIKKEWNKEGNIKSKKNKIEIVVNSKKVCLFLIEEMKMPYGKDKSKKIFIPKIIRQDWKFSRHFIRGIFDTDGTVFAVRKPRVEKYPSIELTTISRLMAEQLKSILEYQGFRVSKIWQFEQTMSENLCYRFGIYGQDNLKKWINEIGFSNPYKMERAISYLK